MDHEAVIGVAAGTEHDGTLRGDEAARLIAERMPEGIEKVFFTNGGADAVEHAIRMARVHTGRQPFSS